MAYKKNITLPTQVVVSYFTIAQIDLPVWHRGNSWTQGSITFNRYVSQEAYKAGADPIDYLTYVVDGGAFTQLNFVTQDGLLIGLYSLLQSFITDFADAEIVDVTPNPDHTDGGVI